jgi:hypothetical protein
MSERRRQGGCCCKQCLNYDPNPQRTALDVIYQQVEECRSADRKNKRLKSDKNTITPLDFIDMLIAQGGRCAKYKHPLTFSLEDGCQFKISVDQLNPGRGYSKQNCILVCAFAKLS